MPIIRLLPPHLANQIAAGEVIERPASVVKELIENALDAGARRIAIAIELGGKALLRVDDDGVGMTGEDARLALQRHATSKIASAEDLAAIQTLGFRGEALPSIASVSRFTLRTRATGETTGTEIQVEGGTVTSAREVGAPEGTSIEVRELFYNLPARRKFLKSDGTEAAQISKLVTQCALGYPEVGFTLTSGSRRLLQCPPVQSLADRFFQMFGERSDLLAVRKEAAGVRLYGFAAALTEQGPTRGQQHLFVNRRIVRDRTVSHAIVDAYSKATIKERSPEVYLFLELPHEAVDVNVHPTKAEVRFREPSLVHEIVRRALMDGLGTVKPPELTLRSPSGAAAGTGALTDPAVSAARPGVLPGVLSGPLPSRSGWTPLPSSSAGTGLAGSAGPAGADRLDVVAGGGALPDAARMVMPEPVETALVAGRVTSITEGLNAALQLRAGQVGAGAGSIERHVRVDPDKPLVPIGQFRDTFIIAIDEDGIAIIDQHVAHERVLFEQIMERLTTGPAESQRLLEPVLIDLSPAQRQVLTLHQEDLLKFGFEVVEFGGESLRIAAVPALLRFEEAAAAVRALAEDLEGLDRGARVEEALRRIAATMACHAAVKANDPLTFEKMQYLLAELRRTAYSSVCPHGRPVILRLSRREIERSFERA